MPRAGMHPKIDPMDLKLEIPPATAAITRRVAGWALRNSLGLIYLAWVAVTAVEVVHSLLTWNQPDANLAVVVPIFQTLPWSLLAGLVALALPVLPGPVAAVLFFAVIVTSALINAVLLSLLGRSVARLIRWSIGHLRDGRTVTA
jgi:hypothetical protein